MKRRWLIGILAACILTGCGRAQDEGKMTEKTAQTVMQTGGPTEEETGMDATGTVPEEPAAPAAGRLQETLAALAPVYNIAQVSGNRLLIAADRLYLVDLISGEIEAEADCTIAKGALKISCDGQNIILIGAEAAEAGDEGIVWTDPGDVDSPKMQILYFDEQLNVQKTVNLFEAYGLNPGFPDCVAVNEAGEIAVYEEMSGELYVCSGENKKKILGDLEEEMVYDGRIQFRITGGIEFVQNSSKIQFQADCLDYPLEDLGMEYCGIGTVAVDNQTVTLHKTGREYRRVQTYPKYSIVSQDCGFTEPTGEVVKYVYGTEEIEWIQLHSSCESGQLYASADGTTWITYEQTGASQWMIRFYGAEDGALHKEVTVDGLSGDSYSGPKVYMCQGTQQAVLYFRSLEEGTPDVFRIIE